MVVGFLLKGGVGWGGDRVSVGAIVCGSCVWKGQEGAQWFVFVLTKGPSRSNLMMQGNKNPAVLPLPVWAHAIKSRSAKPMGTRGKEKGKGKGCKRCQWCRGCKHTSRQTKNSRNKKKKQH